MIFTQEQINEIKKRLALAGIKDTQFPTANFPFKGDETFTIVQEGVNKKMSIDSFSEELLRYIHDYSGKDLFNVSEYIRKAQGVSEYTPITLQEAVAALPEQLLHGGQIITFWNGSNWLLYQYYPSNESWQELLSSEGDEKILPKCVEVIYYTESSTLPSRSLGDIGDYAIVNGAVYQKNISGWELDNIMSQEYFYFRYNDRLYEFREGEINSSIDFSIYLNDSLHHIYLPYFRKLSYSYNPPSNPSEGYYMYYTEGSGYSLHYYSEVSGWSDVSEDTLAPCYFLSTGGLGNIIWEFRNDGNLYPGVEFKIDYSSLTNTPTIGNANLIFKYKGRNLTTFSANATSNVEVDLSNFASYDDLFNIINSKSLLRMDGTTGATISLNTMTSDVTVDGEILYSTVLNRFVLKYLNGVTTKYAKSWHSYGDPDSYNYVRASEYYNSEINNVVAPKADTLFYTINTDTNRVQLYIYNGTSLIALSLGGGDTPIEQEQADWEETDSTQPSYIKNKPTIDSSFIEDSTNLVQSNVIQDGLVTLENLINSKEATTIIEGSSEEADLKISEYIDNISRGISIEGSVLNTPDTVIDVQTEDDFINRNDYDSDTAFANAGGNNVKYVIGGTDIEITKNIILGSNCIVEFSGIGKLVSVGSKVNGSNIHVLKTLNAAKCDIIVKNNQISDSNIIWGNGEFRTGNPTPEMFGSKELDTDYSKYDNRVYNKSISNDNVNVTTIDGTIGVSVMNPDDYFMRNDHYGMGSHLAHYKNIWYYEGEQAPDGVFLLSRGIGKCVFFAYWTNSDFWNERETDLTKLPKARPAIKDKALNIKDVNGDYLCIQGVLSDEDTFVIKRNNYEVGNEDFTLVRKGTAITTTVSAGSTVDYLEDDYDLANDDTAEPKLIMGAIIGSSSAKRFALLDTDIYEEAGVTAIKNSIEYNNEYAVSSRKNVPPRMLVGRKAYGQTFYIERQGVPASVFETIYDISEENDIAITLPSEGQLVYHRKLDGTPPQDPNIYDPNDYDLGSIYKYTNNQWVKQDVDDVVYRRVTSYVESNKTHYVYTKYVYHKATGELLPLLQYVDTEIKEIANFSYVSTDVYYNEDKKCFVLIDPFEVDENYKLKAYTVWNNSTEWNYRSVTNSIKAKSNTLFLNVEHEYFLNTFAYDKPVGSNDMMKQKFFNGTTLVNLIDTLDNYFDNIYYNRIPIANVLHVSNSVKLPNNKVYYIGARGEYYETNPGVLTLPTYLDGGESKFLFVKRNKTYRKKFANIGNSDYYPYSHNSSLRPYIGYFYALTGNNSDVRLGSFGMYKSESIPETPLDVKGIYGISKAFNQNKSSFVRNLDAYCFTNNVNGTPLNEETMAPYYRGPISEPILGCISSSLFFVNSSNDFCLENSNLLNFYTVLQKGGTDYVTIIFNKTRIEGTAQIFMISGVEKFYYYNGYISQKKYSGGSGWHYVYGIDGKCKEFYMSNTTLVFGEFRNQEGIGWHSSGYVRECVFRNCNFIGYANIYPRGREITNSRCSFFNCNFNIWKQPVLGAGGAKVADNGVVFPNLIGSVNFENCNIKIEKIKLVNSGSSVSEYSPKLLRFANCTIFAEMEDPSNAGDYLINCNYNVLFINNTIRVLKGNIFKAQNAANVNVEAYNNYFETNNCVFYTYNSSLGLAADTIKADGNYVVFNQAVSSTSTCYMFRPYSINTAAVENKYGVGSFIKNTYLTSVAASEVAAPDLTSGTTDPYKIILVISSGDDFTHSIQQNNDLINNDNLCNVSFLNNKVYQGARPVNSSSTWSNDFPATTPTNKYLWRKKTYTYGPNSPTTDTAIDIVFVYGESRNLGVTVESIKYYYSLHDKDHRPIIGDGSWYETIPEVPDTGNNTYISTYIDTEYSNGTHSYIGPSVLSTTRPGALVSADIKYLVANTGIRGDNRINDREVPAKGGSTTNRPANIPEGYCYLDTTLGFPIWAHWSETTLTWLKADGTDADS